MRTSTPIHNWRKAELAHQHPHFVAGLLGHQIKIKLHLAPHLGSIPEFSNDRRIIAVADYSKADKDWRIILLRYFNPVGAHPSGARHLHMLKFTLRQICKIAR